LHLNVKRSASHLPWRAVPWSAGVNPDKKDSFKRFAQFFRPKDQCSSVVNNP
jgi:hypothetical protein